VNFATKTPIYIYYIYQFIMQNELKTVAINNCRVVDDGGI